MDKTQFEQILLDEGFSCEREAQYPSVVVSAKRDVKKTYRLIKQISKEKGYDSSFAVRLYREGMSVYPPLSDTLPLMGGGAEGEDEPLDIAADDEPLGDVARLPAASMEEIIPEVSFMNEPSEEIVGASGPSLPKKKRAKKEPKEEVSLKEESLKADKAAEDKKPSIPDEIADARQVSMFDMFSMFGGMGA